MSRSALVVTVVHHPLDARIHHRQIRALLAAGWRVTYAAPWSGYGVPKVADVPGLTTVDLPRSSGRRRWSSQKAARKIMSRLGREHDVVLIHDPELVPASRGLGLPLVVWDVHEDTAAAIEVRPWIPGPLRRPIARLVRAMERAAERTMPLILAEHRYAERFRRRHPVVPNTTDVPDSPLPAAVPDDQGHLRAVYLGSITLERGARELVEVARRLRHESGGRIRLEVIGPAHGPARALLEEAVSAGDLDWPGFVPNDVALGRLEGALAGLSLLHDEKNFRPSMPTKVVEYMAHGLPVITTPLPVPADLVHATRSGLVVPFGETRAVVDQILRWAEDPAEAAAVGRRGHGVALDQFDWRRQGPVFAQLLGDLVSWGRTR